MQSRFNFSVVVLALLAAVVLGTAMLGVIGASFSAGDVERQALAALGGLSRPVTALLALSALAGALGWLAAFLLRADGVHRLEWVAFLPKNYGGRSPFDTSDWRAAR